MRGRPPADGGLLGVRLSRHRVDRHAVLFGIVIGVVAMLGLSVLWRAQRTAGRGRDARRDLKKSQRETAFLNRDRDKLLQQQHVGAESGAAVHSEGAAIRRNRGRRSVAGRAVDNCRAPGTSTAPARHPTQPQSPKTKESAMSIGKKLAHKAEAAKGAAKKFVGRATGNTRLATEGRVDQFKGNTKQAGEKVKDAFKH